MRPLLLVTGTGTEIGKTFLATALVRAWSSDGRRIAGVKPVESGVVGAPADVSALAAASTYPVLSPPPYLFTAAVSPHLAARGENRTIALDVIAAWIERIREDADGTLVELPGGLFSPLTDSLTNADAALRLAPTASVLVASDRLGVLHDVHAVLRAAATLHLHFDAVLLSAPPAPDASTGSNAAELRRLFPAVPIVLSLPRCTPDEAARRLAPVVESLTRRPPAG